MSACEHDPMRLVLLGDLRRTMGLAAELVRGSAASIAVSAADGKELDAWCQTMNEPVVVDVAINLPDVIARLRGERAGDRAMTALVEELVGRSIDEIERALILQTLERCHGNRTTASSMLGISVRTMRNKLKTFLSDGSVPIAERMSHQAAGRHRRRPILGS